MPDPALSPQPVPERVANIGRRQRIARVIWGIIPLLGGVALLVVLLTADVNRWWRLALMGLFIPAFMGFLQAKEKT